ncbi:TrmB family transcriptional regulator [Pseudooceanicola sp. GBMRC 2024]|uniref:TrmB family transcriptional regulator n=1 Tax=Pseudooceanicola albus TaxID=2692189 RepID=A0A6L7G325_9RHOB|nr:TrmB family transcriptional regulator [Pseudooceanicola albus]MXN17908.1 TrmB family transcriptional regulator [Pseudooceanicola albus]
MSITPDSPLIGALSALGFTQYEARAYAALHGNGPGNGHEVAKASGVPPSKIYETLARLLEKGAVLKAQEEPARYLARPWQEVSSALLTRLGGAAAQVEEELGRLEQPARPGTIWGLPDRAAVLSTATGFLATAGRTVFASLWDEELPVLRSALEAAAARGVSVHVAVYGATRLEQAQGYDLTGCGRSAMERLAGRRLMTLVADGTQALVAEIHPGGGVEAIRTDAPVIGLLVAEYVKADVLGRLLIDDMGEARFEALRRDPGLIDRLLRG